MKDKMMELPNKKYNIIYADPPWDFGGGGVYQDNGRPMRETKNQYPLMKTKDIRLLPVKCLSADDCILFLWSTDQHLNDALKVIGDWGFKYSTIGFYWVKNTNKGNPCYNVGCWTMKSVELCLLAIKGHPLKFKQKRNIKQLVVAERTKHSKKPDEVRRRIVELMGDLPRIELFARQRYVGWDAWGNEVSDDVKHNININGGKTPFTTK